MVATMLPILLLMVAVSVADINIDINISGEEEAAVRGVESSEGRNTTSTVLNNSNNNLREVAEDCSEKKVWIDNSLFTFITLWYVVVCLCRLGWEIHWCLVS